MSLWIRVRAGHIVLLSMGLTLAALALRASAATARPSPAGATLAVACFLALAVPVAAGWGCSRGDELLESVSTRPVRYFDLAFVVVAVGLTSGAAGALQQLGFAGAGFIAARAGLAFLGLMLLAVPLAGWRVATTVPAVYLLLVAVVGSGEDSLHPAAWAWIAADGLDARSWILTLTVLMVGLAAYVLLPAGVSPSAHDA